MCYHAYVMIDKLYPVRVGSCDQVAGFYLSLYGLFVLNKNVNVANKQNI